LNREAGKAAEKGNEYLAALMLHDLFGCYVYINAPGKNPPRLCAAVYCARNSSQALEGFATVGQTPGCSTTGKQAVKSCGI